LAGRRDLVRAARLNASPHPDSIGRPLKVGREEIVGVWLAAEKYARLDFAALDRQYAGQANYLSGELEKFQACRLAMRRTIGPGAFIAYWLSGTSAR